MTTSREHARRDVWNVALFRSLLTWKKKKHVRKMWFCGSIRFSFTRLGNVVYRKQWLKARSWWVPIYLYEAISCSDLPEILYRQPLLFLWWKGKEQGIINLIQRRVVLPKTTPGYDFWLTYRFQHGFHHSVVQPCAKGKPLEKPQAWGKALYILYNCLKQCEYDNMTNHKTT